MRRVADQIGVHAGNGVEDIVDGALARSSHAGDAASFAQPSGLATDGKHLFVADSEVSGVRSIGLEGAAKGRVASILGVGLFAFGDIDGRGTEARLQHCLGLAYDPLKDRWREGEDADINYMMIATRD